MGRFLEFLTEGFKPSKKEDKDKKIINLVQHPDGITYQGRTMNDHILSYKVLRTHRPARISITKDEHGMKMFHGSVAKEKGYTIKYHSS